MKLTQDLIVFDLEATVSYTFEGIQEHNNIIQIGAVYLKRTPEHRYELTDRFSTLVKPVGEMITPFITELTGISNFDVEEAPSFREAGAMFRNWASTHGNLKRMRLCAWGTHFDLPLLRSGYEKNGMEYPFVGGGYDIKSWAILWLMLRNHSETFGIDQAMKAMNLTPVGKLHDALADAENTALIALKVMDDFNLLCAADPPASKVDLSPGH